MRFLLIILLSIHLIYAEHLKVINDAKRHFLVQMESSRLD